MKGHVRYQCLVRAYNAAGGYTTVSSDGFWIDEDKPKGGYVVDGADPSEDLLITSERFEFSLGWGGFFGLGEETGLEGLSCARPPQPHPPSTPSNPPTHTH